MTTTGQELYEEAKKKFTSLPDWETINAELREFYEEAASLRVLTSTKECGIMLCATRSEEIPCHIKTSKKDSNT